MDSALPRPPLSPSQPLPPSQPLSPGDPRAERAFIVPADLPGPSGGSAYNDRIQQVWDQQGLGVKREALPGSWPHPDETARRALGELLIRYRQVLVDGIIASAAPQQLARARAAGVRVTVLVHLPLPAETGLSPAQQQKAAASERRALQQADLVVCTSEWARKDLARRYGELPAAAAAPGTEAAPVSRGSCPPHLLFLGAVSPRKNPLLLLRALQPLTHRSWTLTVAGPDGPDPAYVQEVRRAGQHTGAVDVCGPLTGKGLDRVWDSADLLVLPSVAETYGMVITEAVAHGVPALVGAGTGAEEALAAGQSRAGRTDAAGLPGAAVDPTDRAAWTEALSRWLDDASLRHRWHTTALAHRDRLPTWSDAANHLRAALQW